MRRNFWLVILLLLLGGEIYAVNLSTYFSTLHML